MVETIVFGMEQLEKLAKSIAKKAKAKTGNITLEEFPDGESYIKFDNPVKGKNIVLVQSLHPNANNNLVELFFAGRTAQVLGAKSVTGVVPYLAYMRQDKRFHDGECVSNKHMAHLVNNSMDKLITVDPHLHRVHDMADLFYIHHRKVTANLAIADYIKKKFNRKKAVIVGPDIESSQWAKRIADKIGFESAIFLKDRFSSRKVKINVTTELDWKGKDVVIIDDIISSGHTMIEAIKEIKKRKPRAVHCICVHGIFAEGAFEKMKKAGAKTIVSCNSIPHKSNRIDLAPLIVKEL